MAEVDLGPWNFPAAAGIATTKALLIALFFMHVRYSPPLTWLIAGAGCFWLAILIGLTFCDYATRDTPMSTERAAQQINVAAAHGRSLPN
jgi:cytochrome c oxidase subunit 4